MAVVHALVGVAEQTRDAWQRAANEGAAAAAGDDEDMLLLLLLLLLQALQLQPRRAADGSGVSPSAAAPAAC